MRTDLVWRLLLPAAASIALATGASPPTTGGLALVGLGLSTERLVRLRRSGPADQVLVGTGVLVALVLTGLVLDVSGTGLRPATWDLAAIVLAVAGLGVAAVLPARSPTGAGPLPGVSRSEAVRALPWLAVAAVVVVAAVRMSAASLVASDAAPVQLSFGRVDGSQVQVVVTSSTAIGPLEVRTSADGDEISYPLFSVGEGGSRTTTVSLPRTGRFVITVSYPDQTEPLRTLVLDR